MNDSEVVVTLRRASQSELLLPTTTPENSRDSTPVDLLSPRSRIKKRVSFRSDDDLEQIRYIRDYDYLRCKSLPPELAIHLKKEEPTPVSSSSSIMTSTPILPQYSPSSYILNSSRIPKVSTLSDSLNTYRYEYARPMNRYQYKTPTYQSSYMNGFSSRSTLPDLSKFCKLIDSDRSSLRSAGYSKGLYSGRYSNVSNYSSHGISPRMLTAYK